MNWGVENWENGPQGLGEKSPRPAAHNLCEPESWTSLGPGKRGPVVPACVILPSSSFSPGKASSRVKSAWLS